MQNEENMDEDKRPKYCLITLIIKIHIKLRFHIYKKHSPMTQLKKHKSKKHTTKGKADVSRFTKTHTEKHQTLKIFSILSIYNQKEYMQTKFNYKKRKVQLVKVTPEQTYIEGTLSNTSPKGQQS